MSSNPFKRRIFLRALIQGVLMGAGVSLSAGELPIPAGALATLGKASLTNYGSEMVVHQTTNQAILNWYSFNIGAGNQVKFVQPSSTSVALNRIFQSDPSQILGKLSANGQVYLVNPNGFVFGNGSSVNVNTLVASTLDISDQTLEQGITKVEQQTGAAAFSGFAAASLNTTDGKSQAIGIDVGAGASITAAKNGRIILVAPVVTNEGQITANDGQVILAAATDKVYLQEVQGDPNLRGLIVEVGTGGSVKNQGSITTNRGNTTLVGFAVNQEGVISAKTSVDANGSITLLAEEGATTQQGDGGWNLSEGQTTRPAGLADGLGTQASVSLGANSKTIATPDVSSQKTEVNGVTQLPSIIDITGEKIDIGPNALVQAKSGRVTLTATDDPSSTSGLPAGSLTGNSSISISATANIDASGVAKVAESMSKNLVTLRLGSIELRDEPVQRNGILNGQTVTVDLRTGTQMADISGAVAKISNTVAERSTTGGTITLNSGGSVNLAKGSTLDVSGGSVDFAGGYVQTTQLVSSGGKTVDIGVADPNQTYVGVVGSAGQNALTASGGRYEASYLSGVSAGSIDIKTALLDLQGDMKAVVVNAPIQRTPDQQAKGGTLSLDLTVSPLDTQSVILTQTQSVSGLSASQATSSLSIGSDVLRQEGFQSFDVMTNGRISLGQGDQFSMGNGSKISLSGGAIDLLGSITSHGGQLALETTQNSASDLDGHIQVGENVKIDLSGTWNNDLPAASNGKGVADLSPLWVNGGNFTAKAAGDLSLASGSIVDVSGGAQRTFSGQLNVGNAGSIQLSAQGSGGSTLSLGGALYGYAITGGKGGSLSLASQQIEVASPTAQADRAASNLVLDPSLFRDNGFASFDIVSNKNGLTVDDNTQVHVEVSNRILDLSSVSEPTGSDLKIFSTVGFLDEVIRPSASVTFGLQQSAGNGGANAAVSIGEGAEVAVDPGGTIQLVSDGSILQSGTLTAQGGTINLHVTPPVGAEQGFLSNQGIWLNAGSKLDASGVGLVYQKTATYLAGKVLGGGTINLSADRGFIMTDSSSVMTVNGAGALMNLPTSSNNYAPVAPLQWVYSSGGNIHLTSAEGIQLNGILDGNSGGGRASGGDLTLELNPGTRQDPGQFAPGQSDFPNNADVIEISSSLMPNYSAPSFATGVNQNLYGIAQIAGSQVSNGGFSALSLKSPGALSFQGDLTLKTTSSLTLDVPVIQASNASAVTLVSPHLVMGSTQVLPGNADPVTGAGSLNLSGEEVDLQGTTAVQGFGKVNVSSQTDIRLDGIRTDPSQNQFLGEFLVAGDLSLKAQEIAPSTLSQFNIAIESDSVGLLSILPVSGTPPTVLSAAGKVSFLAPNISQGGVIKAPLGEIDFTASQGVHFLSGSRTSVSAQGETIPFGRVQGGTDWIYPLGLETLVYATPPEKKIVINAAAVNLDHGATLDANGGGKLEAFEFQPGPGGSYDVLDPSSAGYFGSFAIIPSYKGLSAPIDPLDPASASGLQVGASVYLAGGGGLAAGTYTLLPAHYALLPGAFLVTPDVSVTSIVPGITVGGYDGSTVVAGYTTISGSGTRTTGWSGFDVLKGADVSTLGTYSIHTTDSFYSKVGNSTTSLPVSGGTIQVISGGEMALWGRIEAQAGPGGVSGQLDLDANVIKVLADASELGEFADGLQITASALDHMAVGSIFLGGLRENTDTGVSLDVGSREVVIGQQEHLIGKDFLLAATDSLEINRGAIISSATEKKKATGIETLTFQGDGAVVGVSSTMGLNLARSQVEGQQGSIFVAQTATIKGDAGTLMDATADNTFLGKIDAGGGMLDLGARNIALGVGAGTTSGLDLTVNQLKTLHASSLILDSGSNVGFYGPMTLNAESLTLHAAALEGFGASGQNAAINASQVTFDNTYGSVSSNTASGAGNLLINAKTLILGQGQSAIQGFAQWSVNATQTVVGSGTADIKVTGDVSIRTPEILGTSASDTRLDASGYDVALSATGEAHTISSALGSHWGLTANTIEDGTSIFLPSGSLTMTALMGDIQVASGSSIDLSGHTLTLGGVTQMTDGGSLNLSTASGSILLDSGSTINLSGDAGGQLSALAPLGQFTAAGSIDAQGITQGGDLAIKIANGSSLGDVGQLLSNFNSKGFTHDLSLDAVNGNLQMAVGGTVSAHQVVLNAETGDLDVGGTIQAQGSGALVQLASGGVLHLEPTARLIAQGVSTQVGQVVLDSFSDQPAGKGLIKIDDGARIQVASNDGSDTGSVILRAARTSNDVAIQGNPGAAILGASDVEVQGMKSYEVGALLSANDLQGMKSDADGWMASMNAIDARLGLTGATRPGIGIYSQGDLTFSGADLSSWRWDGRAGYLSLNAGGTLTLSGALSDGFVNSSPGASVSGASSVSVIDQLMSGHSWSYSLSAGQDVVVTSTGLVRTGTGSIDISSGRDILLQGPGSVIYTAGRSVDGPLLTVDSSGSKVLEGYVPTDGGNITMMAGRDIVATASGQFFDWLNRTSGPEGASWTLLLGGLDSRSASSSEPQIDSASSSQIHTFSEGVGTLGGGTVEVRAGRNIRDLSVVIPTTYLAATSNAADTGIQGGGNLSVHAQGSIDGGLFFTGNGQADIQAGGNIGNSSSTGLGVLVGIGSGNAMMKASGDIQIGGIFNPTVIDTGTRGNLFFSYDASSGFSAISLSGNIEVQQDPSAIVSSLNRLRDAKDQIDLSGSESAAFEITPSSLDLRALQGNIQFDQSLIAFPSPEGTLSLVAGANITTANTDQQITVMLSDADASLLPGITHPANTWDDAYQRLQPVGPSDLIHSQIPVHQGQDQTSVIYAGGSIGGVAPLRFSLPNAVDVTAGLDMKNTSLDIEHPDSQISTLTVGRDLLYTEQRNSVGNLISGAGEITVGGPGELLVTAGRDIQLGSSAGIETTGNYDNPELSSSGGASVTLMAGVGQKGADFAGFAKWDNPLSNRRLPALAAFVQTETGKAGLSPQQLKATYNGLSAQQKDTFLLQLFFDDLRLSTTNEATSGNTSDYATGKAAIKALFPGIGKKDSAYLGDIDLYYSTIRTLDGGDVNFLVPGGSVNVGLASGFSGTKSTSDLGMLVEGAGGINGFATGNINVNESRIFALGGGDISLWSSQGNIDAGRGAQTALTVEPPQSVFDGYGNLLTITPPPVSGSGIRTGSEVGESPGDIYLAAPSGVVNANQAGIAGHNVTIAATAVIGASNISVSGLALGVPQAGASLIPPVSAVASASAAGQIAEDAIRNDMIQADEKDDLGTRRQSPLVVDVLGFGECSVTDIRSGRTDCKL